MAKEKRGQRTVKKGSSKSVKEAVWARYCKDKGGCRCYICSREIHFEDFELGRLKETEGRRPRIDNLRPICRNCSHMLGDMPIEAYERVQQDIKDIHLPEEVSGGAG